MSKNNQQKNIFYNKKSAFTLIEVMVSVAIFTIIMTVGMGALVNITQNYSYAREKKTVADNLSFMLESITREIRLGSEYYSGSGSSGSFFQNPPRDGNASSIGFVMANPGDVRGQYMSYSLESGILKRYRYDTLGSPLPVDNLNDPNAVIIDTINFTVIGASLSGTSDGRQPLVWIRMKAHSSVNDAPLSLQTLVSQRALDF